MRKNSYQGKFILFEGIDGSGKTMQAHILTDRLQKEGYQAFFTREPTSETIFGNLARFIYMRESLHEKASAELRRCMEGAEYQALRVIYDDLKIAHIGRFEKIAHEVMMGEYKNLPTFLQLCMIFDRYHHHVDTIIPKLKEGVTVVADRDFLSTLAYSAGDDIPWQPLLVAHEEILGHVFIMPNLLFFIDVPVEVGLARTMAKQSGKKDYFDTQAMLTKIRGRYREVCSNSVIADNVTVTTINGDVSPQDAHDEIWHHVRLFMETSVSDPIT